GAGSLRARHYAPERAEGAPLLLYLHGGGFVLGDLETYDPLCRLLCRHARVHVLAVEYRLAPEHRYPAAFHDALAAIAWAQENAAALGADPARVAIGGDSAGANLAASVTQQLRNARAKLPAAQLLLYPPVDRSVAWRSLELFAEGFFLTRNDIEVFHRHYVGERTAEAEPRVSSLCAGELGALPPSMVITAGFDPLRDEGEAYAAALRAAGSPVLLRRFDGLIHGFANMAGVSRSCREAVIELAAAFGAMLDTTQHGQQKRSAA
ncbi:MAG: alpha/beta hydrolase, partial [Myxococcales bacterium]